MAAKNTKATDPAKALETGNAMYIAEIGRLQARLGELSSEVGRLRAELEQKRGVRPAVRALYRSIDKAIIARLEARGYKRPKPRRSVSAVIPAEVLATDDPRILAEAAQRYDAQAYFRLKASKTGMRLGYRIAGGVYHITRDASVYGLKKMYRLAKRGKS